MARWCTEAGAGLSLYTGFYRTMRGFGLFRCGNLSTCFQFRKMVVRHLRRIVCICPIVVLVGRLEMYPAFRVPGESYSGDHLKIKLVIR